MYWSLGLVCQEAAPMSLNLQKSRLSLNPLFDPSLPLSAWTWPPDSLDRSWPSPCNPAVQSTRHCRASKVLGNALSTAAWPDELKKPEAREECTKIRTGS